LNLALIWRSLSVDNIRTSRPIGELVKVQTSRRTFLQTSALASLYAANTVLPLAAEDRTEDLVSDSGIDAFVIAKRHTMRRQIAGPTFLEGMLLGNGDVGVCAVVRPDALGLHIGKNDCWDIRVSEPAEDQVLSFADLLAMWKRASEEAKKQGKPEMVHLEENIDFFREYARTVEESYRKKWPRPWPCGTIWINWDVRWVEPMEFRLDPSDGLFTLDLKCTTLENESRTVELQAFVDRESGLISVSTNEPLEVRSIVFSPEVDGLRVGAFDAGHMIQTTDLLPPPQTRSNIAESFAEFSCSQILPAIGPTEEMPTPRASEKDRNFSLLARINGHWKLGSSKTKTDIALTAARTQVLSITAIVGTPRDVLLRRLEQQAAAAGAGDSAISIPQTHVYTAEERDTPAFVREELDRLLHVGFGERRQLSQQRWRDFWSRSAVQLKNQDLERIWYHNQYFLACCLKKNKVAPGLFANWSAGDIGTAWHGDYHTDYNCQQVYWSVFSSNHPEMHSPYVELCENLLAMSEKFAHDKFLLPGAFFPLSAYPVPSQAIPYPVPAWAYQVSMTPWTVQSLWWQYLYTQDEEELKRVYPLLRSAARFLVAYVEKGADGKYHVVPTVSSENWGFTVDFRLNRDCILDLALTQFLLDAVVSGSTILGVDQGERSHWSEVRRNLAPYPKVNAPYGEVWLDVSDAPPDWVYNIPITLAPVFPGEQVGLGSEESLTIARRTARTIRLEGGNDLVYQPLIRARLGVLDLDWFVREVRYCSLPNSVANDRIRQSGGRYAQSADFDFMMPMGVWCENFALPVVVNECMMQSYSGTIRIFPNTTNLGPAQFHSLRAVGAFLVSAAYDGSSVTDLSLFSEKGKEARIVPPWSGRALRVIRLRDHQQQIVHPEAGVCRFSTESGQTYQLSSV
jgi:alpha-L-fucosidase 2